MGKSPIPEDVSAVVAGWFRLLAEAETWEPYLLLGADIGSSFELCAEFVKQSGEKEILTPELKEAGVAARAILAELRREQSDKPPLNPHWQESGLEPHFVDVLRRGPTVGRFVMAGCHLGRARSRSRAFLRVCEPLGELSPPLQCAVRAVRTLLAMPEARQEEEGLPSPLRKLAFASAAATALLAVAATCIYIVQDFRWKSYATKVGDYRSVRLGLGSIVELNTDTKIRYRESADRSEVRLEVGEARFKVAHNPARTFIVYVGDLVIQDVGTEFSVRLWENGKIEVVVARGEVAIHRRSKRGVMPDILSSSPPSSNGGTHVEAGHKATDEKGQIQLAEISAAEIQDREAWRNSEVIFGEMSLAEIVQELNRYSERKIRIVDPALGARELGGKMTFNTRDLDETLSRLKMAARVRVSGDGSNELLLEDQNAKAARH